MNLCSGFMRFHPKPAKWIDMNNYLFGPKIVNNSLRVSVCFIYNNTIYKQKTFSWKCSYYLFGINYNIMYIIDTSVYDSRASVKCLPRYTIFSLYCNAYCKHELLVYGVFPIRYSRSQS